METHSLTYKLLFFVSDIPDIIMADDGPLGFWLNVLMWFSIVSSCLVLALHFVIRYIIGTARMAESKAKLTGKTVIVTGKET